MRLGLLYGLLAAAVKRVDNPFIQGSFGGHLDWCDGGVSMALKKALELFTKEIFQTTLSSSSSSSSEGHNRHDDSPLVMSESISFAIENLLKELDLMEPDAHATNISVLGFFNVIQSVLNIFKQPSAGNLTKLEQLGTAFCKIVEKEYETLDGKSPMACFGQDLAVTLSACSVELRSNLPDFTDCETPNYWGFVTPDEPNLAIASDGELYQVGGSQFIKSRLRANTSANSFSNVRLRPEVIPGFPQDEVCYTHTGEQFKFNDPKLVIPLNMVNRTFDGAVPWSVRKREMLTYLTIWRGIVIFYRFLQPACRPYFKNPNRIPVFIPGWKTLSMINLSQYNGENPQIFPSHVSLPLAAVLKRADKSVPCKVLVLFRGSQTDAEWIADFYYHAIPLGDGVTAHAGMMKVLAGVFDSVYSQVKDALDGCSCEDSEVIFAGHSLGGAAAILLSDMFAKRVKDTGDRTCPVTIYTVAISSPRVLSHYRPDVVWRYISDKKDMLFSFPCFHGKFEGTEEGTNRVGWPRCGPGHAVLSGKGADNFPTPAGRVVMNAGFKDQNDNLKSQDFKTHNTTQRHVGVDSFQTLSAAMRSVTRFPSTSWFKSILPQGLAREQAKLMGTQSIRDAVDTLAFHMDAAELLYLVPNKEDLVVGHDEAISCGLSSGCRATPESNFVWRCNEYSF